MRKYLFTWLATVPLTACVIVADGGGHHAYAAGSGDTMTETRPLPGFSQIESSRGVIVTVSCGATPQAVLSGPSEEVRDMELEVHSGTLVVRRGSNHDHGRYPVRVDLTAPGPLDRLEAGSGSSLSVPSCAMSSERIRLDAHSGADIKVAGNARSINAEASSGASIMPLRGARLDGGSAKVSASSGGTVRICAAGRLDASASSGGSIASESAGQGDRSSHSGGSIETRSCS